MVHPGQSIPPQILEEALQILRQGGLVAFPTETVYGLGADASNSQALQRLYEVKGRPLGHPVIVHLGHTEQLTEWAQHIPASAYRLAEAFWPGPLTLILPRAPHVLDTVTGGQDTVGLRIPNHPVALALLQAFGGGVAAPSANRFGRVSPTTADHVQEDLGTDVDLVLEGGACQVGVESTIVDLSRGAPRLLRPGMITAEQLEAVLGEPVLQGDFSLGETKAPGLLKSHYAPHTPVQLFTPDTLSEVLEPWLLKNLPVAVLATVPADRKHAQLYWQVAPADPQAYAQALYGTLRLLDERNAAVILVQSVPSEGFWRAVSDRLERAAYREGAPHVR